ncbi:hypothetical protein CHUAL_009725 [Chamberlinius hualienensis]
MAIGEITSGKTIGYTTAREHTVEETTREYPTRDDSAYGRFVVALVSPNSGSSIPVGVLSQPFMGGKHPPYPSLPTVVVSGLSFNSQPFLPSITLSSPVAGPSSLC